jgi:ATP-binding cassette subfamily B protein
MSPARRLLGYMGRHRARYLAGALCLVVATTCALGIPWSTKAAVDALRTADGGTVARAALLILAFAIVNGLARLGSRLSMIGAGQQVEHDIRRDMFGHLTTLPPVYYQRQRTGDLVSRASSDVSTVRMLAGFGAAMLVQTSLAFGGTVTAMWLIDPWLTLWALLPAPALTVLTKRASHAVEAQSAAVQAQLGALSAKVQEHLAGMTVVRAYTMEAREIQAFDRLNREYLVRSLRLSRTQALYWPLMGLIAGIGTLVIVWLGGQAVMDGRISLGAFVAFNAYLGYLAWPTVALGWTLANVNRGLAAMGRIAEVLDAEGAATAGEARDEAIARGARIDIRGLTFAHDGREPALHEVSLTVPAGELAVVVGPTGSGKSTLGALLVRLLEPPPGTLFLDGRDVRDLPLPALRRAVGYVPQDAFLFSRSLRDNLRFADPAAADDRLEDAASVAGLLPEIRALPDGWNTVVGERGLTLSGGQRQRAALARALVGDPAVLVLDDPFAAVDAAKEREIFAGIREGRGGRTVLLFTHRLSAAQAADRVIVLDDGRVVEQGSHAALVAAGGLYARLWRIQQIEDELAEA